MSEKKDDFFELTEEIANDESQETKNVSAKSEVINDEIPIDPETGNTCGIDQYVYYYATEYWDTDLCTDMDKKNRDRVVERFEICTTDLDEIAKYDASVELCLRGE